MLLNVSIVRPIDNYKLRSGNVITFLLLYFLLVFIHYSALIKIKLKAKTSITKMLFLKTELNKIDIIHIISVTGVIMK